MQIEIKEINAYKTYNLRQQVMWPNKPLDYIKLEQDQDGHHFGLYKNNIIVSVISLFINKNNAQFRKFATDIKEQGKGYGSILLKHVILFSENNNIKKIWCNARKDKSEYYKRFGLTTSNITFSKGGINFVIMEKNI